MPGQNPRTSAARWSAGGLTGRS